MFTESLQYLKNKIALLLEKSRKVWYNTFDNIEAWQAATTNAHYIWYWFAAIGLISAIALIIYAKMNKTKEETV